METNVNVQANDEVEIDLKEIMFLLLDRLIVILLVGVLAAGLAFLGTKFLITPKYQSTTSIYIMNQNDESKVNASDYTTSNFMTKDYEELITCPPVMEQVIADLDLDFSVGVLESMITIENKQDTRILYITVTDTDPARARQIADAVRATSAVKIKDIMKIEDVNTVSSANLSSSPVSPNVFKNMIIGAALGIIIAIAVIVIMHITDDTIKSPDEIEKYLGISTLATIPVMSEAEYDGKGSSSGHSKSEQSKQTARPASTSSKPSQAVKPPSTRPVPSKQTQSQSQSQSRPVSGSRSVKR